MTLAPSGGDRLARGPCHRDIKGQTRTLAALRAVSMGRSDASDAPTVLTGSSREQ